MPVKSPKQWGFMGAVRSGKIKKPGLSPAKAKEFMDATPAADRGKFAKAQGRKRKTKFRKLARAMR